MSDMEKKVAVFLVANLTGLNFGEIWNAEEIGLLNNFICILGVPANGFVIAWPIEGGSEGERNYCWYFYSIQLDADNDEKGRMRFRCAVAPRTGYISSKCPEIGADYPVWHLTKGVIDRIGKNLFGG